MQRRGALLLALGILSLTLAGCSSGGSDSSGFSVKTGAPGTYTFTAAGKADNYTWDLGDHLTVLYGKSVTHTYDFKNGKVAVVLTSKVGTAPKEARKDLVLGTGQNADATFILEAQTNWTITGETMRFSAAQSTDPDGDALRYSWSCVRTADAVRIGSHTHPVIGIPYGTPPAGAVTARLATKPMPAADRVVDGDFCDALGAGGRPSTAATIEGKFTKTGKYDVYLLASDPVHASTSGKFSFLVTKPEERPAPVQVFSYGGTFQGGSDGTAQSFCDQANGGNCPDLYDEAEYHFALPLNGLNGSVQLTKIADPSTQGNMSWTLLQGENNIAGGNDGPATTLDPATLRQGAYTLRILLHTGVNVEFNATVTVNEDMDPLKVY